MRITRSTYTTTGFQPWITINYLQATFNVNIAIIPSSAATISVTVQYTLDDPSLSRNVTVSQAGSTTATITDANHGLSVADSVDLMQTGRGIDGQYQVATVVSANQYTVTVPLSLTYTEFGAQATSFRVYNAASPLVTAAARVVGNLAAPITMVRANIITLTGGTVDLVTVQGMGS